MLNSPYGQTKCFKLDPQFPKRLFHSGLTDTMLTSPSRMISALATGSSSTARSCRFSTVAMALASDFAPSPGAPLTGRFQIETGSLIGALGNSLVAGNWRLVVTDDTTRAASHFGARSFDLLVSDLPYGVHHGSTADSGLHRSPIVKGGGKPGSGGQSG